MPERRRAHRFAMSESKHAVLRLMDDVYIERADAAETTVIAAQPVSEGEEILLGLPSCGATRGVMLTKALRSTLVPFGATLRHRVVLRTLQACAHDRSVAAEDGQPHQPARMAVLVRRIPVSLAEVSTSGCRLESSQALLAGTIGILMVPTEGCPAGEPLRISRCTRTAGSTAAFRLGAEFLPLDAPAPTSLRNTVARLEIVLELASPLARTSSWPAQSAEWVDDEDPLGQAASEAGVTSEEPTV